MIQDLAPYDLRELILADRWPEEEQGKLVVQFSSILSQKMAQELSEKLSEEQDQQFNELVKQPNLTPEQVQEFYKTAIPDLEQEMDRIALEFKRDFVIKMYQNKVAELEQSPTPNQEAITAWKEIQTAAEQDDWTTAWTKVRALPAA